MLEFWAKTTKVGAYPQKQINLFFWSSYLDQCCENCKTFMDRETGRAAGSLRVDKMTFLLCDRRGVKRKIWAEKTTRENTTWKRLHVVHPYQADDDDDDDVNQDDDDDEDETTLLLALSQSVLSEYNL